MSYEKPLDVMLGLFSKLMKAKDKYYNQIAEFTLQLKLLEGKDGSQFLYNEIEKKKDKAEENLWKTKLQLDLLQKKRNGGASLEPFFTQMNLDKVKDKLNEDLKDSEIKVESIKKH